MKPLFFGVTYFLSFSAERLIQVLTSIYSSYHTQMVID